MKGYGAPVIAAAALAAGLALAACGSPPRPGPVAAASPSASVTASPAVSTAVTPSTSPAARLTTQQAARAYLRIVDPVNRATGTVNTDRADDVLFSQFRADTRTYVAALRKGDAQLRATRWPARVQPYVTAMLLTYDPASIRCAQAEAAAGSYAAATSVSSTNQDCIAAQDIGDPQQIRALLHLPPMQG
ncbi:MAG TPA: hypothetical protein VNF47_21495 [Streptosporangiaceae bacterium]|nr:hypothetical protein [Streptosporangiaceae bacterium]